MDLEIIMLSEVSHKENDIRCHMLPYDVASMWNLNYNTNELLPAKQKPSQTQRTDLWLPWGKIDWGFEISRCKLLYIQIPLHSTGNSIQYRVTNHNQKHMKNNVSYMHNRITLLYSRN